MKMSIKLTFLASFFTICVSQAAVLLWSNNKLEISPLNDFNDENLQDLVQKLGYPEVSLYKSSPDLLPRFEGLLTEYYRAYNPNGDISTENATEITGDDDLLFIETKQRSDLLKSNNTLSILYLPNERHKRETSTPNVTEPTVPKGEILYRGKSNKDIYSLLYSSKPLLLRQSGSNTSITLGKTRMVTVDTTSRDPYTRLYVKVPVEESNVVILQFFFLWSNSYWSLTSVKVSSTNENISANLSITEPFSVPARFSYHCSGVTVFTDTNNTTELVIYDMQVQTDSRDGQFGDVYDCVDFTTVPIWSGLFVTALLGVGLVIALTAISEIKTMDKFDNQKTKQLVITVAE